MKITIRFKNDSTIAISNVKRYSLEISRHDDNTADVRVTIIADEIYNIPVENIVYITAEGNCNE